MNNENEQNEQNEEDIVQDFQKLAITPTEYTVLSIDIGIHHLGISLAKVNVDFTLKEIVWIDLIDITRYVHRNGPKVKECKLHHTKTFSDWVEHVIQENNELFEYSDFILIERQPPLGFVVIEQLIFNKYRHKTYLISPKNVHNYLNITRLDYDKRKEYTVKAANMYLSNYFKQKLLLYERSHDIADSICMMLYWLDKSSKKYRIDMHHKQFCVESSTLENIFQRLEKFRYINKDASS